MRYFIGTDKGVVVSKQAIEGMDDTKIDAAITAYKERNPAIVVAEVDKPTFYSVDCKSLQTQDQRDWIAFKATTPTAFQAILYLAHFLGLE